MGRIFGFDIGTTSIGSAVIDQDLGRERGNILHLGARIFPEARDPDGIPLNQTKRKKRLARRQLRRRRMRRRALNECLREFGLFPVFNTTAWHQLMNQDPLELRKLGLTERLNAEQLGRALYHLSKRRQQNERDLDEVEQTETPDEKQAKINRESMLRELKVTGETLGERLSQRGPHERKRGVHANRAAVADEFERFWSAQAVHHAVLNDPLFRTRVEEAIFAQRPVFWRKSTLGDCPFMPGESLCPKGSWLSQQRRMLEKVNNLAVSGGNARPLDDEERNAILRALYGQASIKWGGVQKALKPVYRSHGEPGLEKSMEFNLQVGGDKTLPGNFVEAKLVNIFGDGWETQPHRQAIRDAIHHRLWSADYDKISDQRVVIRADNDRKQRRTLAAQSFVDDFGVGAEQAAALAEIKLPSGWEPYSIAALEKFLPHLEQGVRFGALVNGPEWEGWRAETFPNRKQPTGEVLDRLPSPADRNEQRRINTLRNPTVIRIQNELRKVVNNLIGIYGKPDLIRIELTRTVGKSKHEREKMQKGMYLREKERKTAADDLRAKGVADTLHNIEKWLLWKECDEFDPYSGLPISFGSLFGNVEFEVEHIWPRWKSFDNSFANKTLCLTRMNARKTNNTPFEAFGQDDDWPRMKERMWAHVNSGRMAAGKAKRFCSEEPLDDGFVSRQLNDTGYAARQAVIFLKRLWPDVGIEAPVTVQAVSGRVTAQLRKAWCLNNILADDGEKTRADHRHHAVDALVIACTHPGLMQRLSAYLQAKKDPTARRPHLPPPWPTIRVDAARAVAAIVVSHRVRKKVSGPLHKETTYGDTGQDVTKGGLVYREFVTRKKVEALTTGELSSIRDPVVREIVTSWVASHGGNPKKAFATYPKVGKSTEAVEIRKVRLVSKQQVRLMAEVSTGYADLGSNHHVAIYRLLNGKVDFEVVSLLKASRRLANRQPVVTRSRQVGETFLMSLCPGDTIRFAKLPEEPPSLWRVQKIASKGQISLLSLTDASPKEPSLFEPMVGGIVSRNAVKLSVDPIGRIRSAND